MSLHTLSRFLLLAICFWTVSASGGTISAGLSGEFSKVGEQDKLPVLISLANQADLENLQERRFRAFDVPLAERHAVLRDSLQAASSSGFEAVRASLSILERNGMVSDVKALWLANMLAANVTRAGAELIANFESVQEVGLDEAVRLLEPAAIAPAQGQMLTTESALKTMRAPDAWAENVLGAGVTVAVLGTPLNSSALLASDRAAGPEALLVSVFCSDASAVMMGCAVGVDSEKGDTVGVAPQAKWRLMSLVCSGNPRVSHVIERLQLVHSSSFADAPAVILQAWEIGDSCRCVLPQAAWTAFANVEQLGSILIWAAGDHGGEGRGSIRLPAARASESLTFFSVGSLQDYAGTLVLEPRSSRGPSPCDRKTIKPELSAPSADVRSAGRNGVVKVTGSLCAAGYVAGACALMRQVNPELSPLAAKVALQLAARDLGATGEDNEFGYGVLDIDAAVRLAQSSSKTGSISGVVRYGGDYVSGARAFLVSNSGSYSAVSNAEGKFRFGQVPAEQKFALYVARFGYKDFAAPDSVFVEQRKDRSFVVDLERGLADDAEVDRGFIFGVAGDNATSGVWTRAIPIGSVENGAPVQVSDDGTAYGSFCFVTGSGADPAEPAASHDVDGGRTTLRSPMFRLDNLAEPKLRFKYAYSNDRGPQKGGDFFRVQVSNDAGESWTNLIQTSVSTDGWQDVQFELEDFVKPTALMIVQFVAEDNAPPSLVEAAIDDIFVEGRPDAPEPPKNLALTPSETGIQLTWSQSEGASGYKVYMAGEQGHVFAPENFFVSLPDTFLFVPFDQIPYERFYFQVTAVK
ncbi:MAG: S8 family serine peptidase [bacterium]|nr:S8 family serine peptidase [bacterium]